MEDKIKLILITTAFIVFYHMPYYMPQAAAESENPLLNGLFLLHDYASKHVLTCLVPAFFIAGAISVFIKKGSILKYLGAEAKKIHSYAIASVSGTILAICSCTVLPLFAGIRGRGAGLGPATTFLFSGPAINIAAIFLTASVLGWEMGAARITSAVLLAILVGLSMDLIFREKPVKGEKLWEDNTGTEASNRIILLFFASMVSFLVVNGLQIDATIKYSVMLFLVLLTAYIAYSLLPRESAKSWFSETWRYTKMLLPVLFAGVFLVGVIMPIIPSETITGLVGSNTIESNLVASVFGAFMYFSTLTEIPILQALLEKGMSKGPALALLLAGPSLSLPNMLVIRKVLGSERTAAYITLVIVYSTVAGLIYGLS